MKIAMPIMRMMLIMIKFMKILVITMILIKVVMYI